MLVAAAVSVYPSSYSPEPCSSTTSVPGTAQVDVISQTAAISSNNLSTEENPLAQQRVQVPHVWNCAAARVAMPEQRAKLLDKGPESFTADAPSAEDTRCAIASATRGLCSAMALVLYPHGAYLKNQEQRSHGLKNSQLRPKVVRCFDLCFSISKSILFLRG